MTLIKRLDKGSKLSILEMDGNLDHLNKPQRGFVWVSVLADLPDPVTGVITGTANTTYYFMNDFDFTGNRFVTGQNNVILGPSSENAKLTSTGLGVGVPLITITQTTVIRHITIEDVDTGVSVDGGAGHAGVALDWTGVNFENVNNNSFRNFGNFIFTKGAFLSSVNNKFGGNFATVAFTETLFSSDNLTSKTIIIEADAICSRRFRAIYSAVVTLPNDTFLEVEAGATIPDEKLILDTVDFSGGGTFFLGVAESDVISFFKNCNGIINSAEISYYTMNGNATVTPVTVSGNAYKILGTTVSNALTQKFVNTDNRATYKGGITRLFQVTVVVSVEAGNNNQIGVYLGKNGTLVNEAKCTARLQVITGLKTLKYSVLLALRLMTTLKYL